jgi:hypothetical protein
MREQECAEAKGKVVIALYSGHLADLANAKAEDFCQE